MHPVFLCWDLSVQNRFKVDWGLQVLGYHLLQSLEIKKKCLTWDPDCYSLVSETCNQPSGEIRS